VVTCHGTAFILFVFQRERRDAFIHAARRAACIGAAIIATMSHHSCVPIACGVASVLFASTILFLALLLIGMRRKPQPEINSQHKHVHLEHASAGAASHLALIEMPTGRSSSSTCRPRLGMAGPGDDVLVALKEHFFKHADERLAMRRCEKLRSPIVINDSANSAATMCTEPVKGSSRLLSDALLAQQQDVNQDAREDKDTSLQDYRNAQSAEARSTTETHITQPSPPSQRQRLNRFERL
jgi:hypothetical protein